MHHFFSVNIASELAILWVFYPLHRQLAQARRTGPIPKSAGLPQHSLLPDALLDDGIEHTSAITSNDLRQFIFQVPSGFIFLHGRIWGGHSIAYSTRQ